MFKKLISSPMGLGETKTGWFYMKDAAKFLKGEVSFEIGKEYVWGKMFLVKIIDIQEPEVKLSFMKFKF